MIDFCLLVVFLRAGRPSPPCWRPVFAAGDPGLGRSLVVGDACDRVQLTWAVDGNVSAIVSCCVAAVVAICSRRVRWTPESPSGCWVTPLGVGRCVCAPHVVL